MSNDSFFRFQTHLLVEAENTCFYERRIMSEQTYSNIPNFRDSSGKEVLGRDVTETFGTYIVSKIRGEQKILADMNFPRLRLARFLGLGYSSDDYYEIAKLISNKIIKVYETAETEKTDFLGVYHNSNKFIFAQKLTKSPDTHLGTIIHEVTHAIQDLKKWRESDRDREVDAHFAGAYFMVLKGQESFLKASKYNGYINLAKNVKGNPNYFKTIEFSRKVTELQNTITQEYGWEYKDDLNKVEDFHKRQRWDGIAS